MRAWKSPARPWSAPVLYEPAARVERLVSVACSPPIESSSTALLWHWSLVLLWLLLLLLLVVVWCYYCCYCCS